MNKKDVENHRIVASQMDWDELANIIIDLELEKSEFKSYLTKAELKKYDKLLEIYESQKLHMVEKLTIYSPW